jgi:glutathione S-transferase
VIEPRGKTGLPVLYSFRRCPYAMRARMALDQARIRCVMREIVLRDKPAEMLSASPKGTVPVLVLPDGSVLEQSLDIMLWALGHNDPEGWLMPQLGSLEYILALIQHADGPFKTHLDRYKYHTRYDDADQVTEREMAVAFLRELEAGLANGQLFGARVSLADIAIFPFVRQFANVDRAWFDQLPLPALHTWLAGHLASDRFSRIMHKWPVWAQGDADIIAFAA